MDTKSMGQDGAYGAGYAAGHQQGYLEGHRAGFLAGHRIGWDEAMRASGMPVTTQEAAPAAATATAEAPARAEAPAMVSGAAATAIVAAPAPAPAASVAARPSAVAAPLPLHVQEPPVSPEELAREAARRRERRGIQSANISLYLAALLIVAAAALFLTNSSVDDGVRLSGLVGVTALFYAAGLVVHARFPRLRPAAVAFAGTGLALLPVAGLGLDIVVLHRPNLSWLITSVVGLVAFGFAALRLESRVLVFLSLTFVFSAAWSGTEVLSGALASDYAALIGIAAVFTLLAVLRPRWVPPLFLRPLARLHPYVVPSTFIAATLTAGELDRWQYPALVAAMSVYLVGSSFLPGPSLARRLSWWGARTTAVLAAAVGAAQAVDAGMPSLGPTQRSAWVLAGTLAVALGTLVSALLGQRREDELGLSRRAALAEQTVAVFVQAGLVAAASWLSVPAAQGSLAVTTVVFVLTAQFTAWRWGAQGDWLPALAFAVLLLVGLDRWPLAFLAVEGLLYFVARAVWAPAAEGAESGRTWRRLHFVAAARVASLAVLPAVVSAALPESTGPGARAAAVALGLVVAVAVQLAMTGALGSLRRAEFLPRAMTWLLVPVGLVAVAVVGVADLRYSLPGSPISPLFTPAVLVLCAGAVALWAGQFFARPPSTARVSDVGEVAPGALLAVLALESLVFGEGGLSNSALAFLTAVLGASAWRSPRRFRRWVYIWLARASGTVWAMGAFRDLLQDGWRPVVLGQPVTESHMLGAVVLVQIVVPLAVELWGARTGRPLPWTLGDAATVLTIGLLPTMGAGLEMSYATGTVDSLRPLGAVLVVAFAASAAIAGVVLRHRPGSVALAPAASVLTAVTASRDLRMLEVLAGLFAVYAASMVFLAPQKASKGAHLVAARALPVALVVLVAQDATTSDTWVSVVLAGALAAQHLVRRLLTRRAADLPFQEAAYWTGLAAQLALPLGYLAFAQQGPEGGRWVVVLEAILVVVSVVATLRRRPAAGYVGVVGLLLGVVALGPFFPFQPGQFLAAPVIGGQAIALLLVAISALHVAGMALWETPERRGAGRRPWAWTAGAAAFGVSAVMAAVPERSWVLGVAVASCAAVLIAAGYVWRTVATVAATFPLGVVLALPAGVDIARDLVDGLAVPWQAPVQVMAGTLVPAAAALALRWSAHWPGTAGEHVEAVAAFEAMPVRRWSLAGVAAAALALSARVSWEPPAAVVLPYLAVALVAVVVTELPLRFRRLGAEAGAFVVAAALQRALFAEVADVSVFWLAQWYVVLAAVVALLRYYVRRSIVAGRAWLEGSAALLSLTGMWTLFSGDNSQQVWLLVAFAVLTLAGVVLNERRFTAWGAAGVVACVLWSVRAYVYALLAVLGLAIIAAAVWWLARRPRGTLLR